MRKSMMIKSVVRFGQWMHLSWYELVTTMIAISVIICGNVHASEVKTQQQLIAISAKASLAGREACQREMHEDAEEFQQCASQLLAKLPQKTLEQKYTYLGKAYYAWLSSTSAAKGGLPNAQKSALYFLAIFRPLQKKLGVSDLALCKTIEGDCESRNARMLVMEGEGKKGVQ